MDMTRLNQFSALYEGGAMVFDDAGALGRALRDARMVELTLKDLAQASGTNINTVGRVEGGEATIPMTARVAAALGYELKFVLVKKG